MKAIIVDDEYRGREVLASLLRMHCPDVEITGMADGVNAAYETIVGQNPDLVFLDIEMPDGNGFEVLKKFPVPSFRTVFVTSYEQYAIQAIRFRAFDYLLKPVIVQELKTTVNKLEKEIEEHRETDALLRSLREDRKDPERRLEINYKTRLEYICYKDIVLLKGDGNYTFIHTAGGKHYHTSRTLKDYEDELCVAGSYFVRAHKGYIVNMSFVKHYERKNGGELILSNGTVIDVSRRKKEEVLQQLKNFRP